MSIVVRNNGIIEPGHGVARQFSQVYPGMPQMPIAWLSHCWRPGQEKPGKAHTIRIGLASDHMAIAMQELIPTMGKRTMAILCTITEGYVIVVRQITRTDRYSRKVLPVDIYLLPDRIALDLMMARDLLEEGAILESGPINFDR